MSHIIHVRYAYIHPHLASDFDILMANVGKCTSITSPMDCLGIQNHHPLGFQVDSLRVLDDDLNPIQGTDEVRDDPLRSQ